MLLERNVRMPENSLARLQILKQSEYAEWDQLVEQSPYGTIFCKSCWIEAIQNAKVVIYKDKGRIIAGMPLFEKKRFGITICTLPKLTQTWGLVIERTADKLVNINSKEIEIARLF